MTVYVTRISTTINAYHTRKDCPRLESGMNKIAIADDHQLTEILHCCDECNGTVDAETGSGLLDTIRWLEDLLGENVNPQEYLPLNEHTVNCEDPDCVVCNDVLNQYRDVITPLYVHVEGEQIRQEVNHASD